MAVDGPDTWAKVNVSFVARDIDALAALSAVLVGEGVEGAYFLASLDGGRCEGGGNAGGGKEEGVGEAHGDNLYGLSEVRVCLALC